MNKVPPFFRRFRREQSDPHAGWERIGGYDYFADDWDRVPKWVSDQMAKMRLSDMASAGTYRELKGKTYLYRIVPFGHGASIVNILRKRRLGR